MVFTIIEQDDFMALSFLEYKARAQSACPDTWKSPPDRDQ